MKRLLLALALPLLLAGPVARGQAEAPSVKVTTALHADGSSTDLKMDLEARKGESQTYGANKKLIKRSAMTLDEMGNTVEEVVYNPKGEIIGRFNFSYDPSGRLVEQLDKLPNGTLVRRLVYRYGPNGRVCGIDGFDGQGNPLKAAPPEATATTGALQPRTFATPVQRRSR